MGSTGTVVGAEKAAAADDPGRTALIAAVMGFAVDSYDYMLPRVALLPCMAYFVPASLSQDVQTTLYYCTFIAALIGRPVGAVFFGHLGDKLGRRKTSLIAGWGFSSLTLLLLFLPGYRSWGLWSIGVLLFLRLVSGFFLGGQYTAATPLAMEMSPKAKRGFRGGLIGAANPFANVIIAVFVAVLLGTMTSKGIDSTYARVGWRIPFLFGGIISIIYVLYTHRNVQESTVWKAAKRTTKPLTEILHGSNFRSLVQIFIMMTGAFFLSSMAQGVVMGVLHVIGFGSSVIMYIYLAANVVLVGGYIFAGAISQRIGRRLTIALDGVLGATVGAVAWYILIIRGAKQSPVAAFVLVFIILFLGMGSYGIVTSYINERFPTGVRASGYGIGFTVALLIPSFFPFYMLWMKAFMPYQYTQIPLYILGAVLLFIGVLLGPETKDVDFAKEVEA